MLMFWSSFRSGTTGLKTSGMNNLQKFWQLSGAKHVMFFETGFMHLWRCWKIVMNQTYFTGCYRWKFRLWKISDKILTTAVTISNSHKSIWELVCAFVCGLVDEISPIVLLKPLSVCVLSIAPNISVVSTTSEANEGDTAGVRSCGWSVLVMEVSSAAISSALAVLITASMVAAHTAPNWCDFFIAGIFSGLVVPRNYLLCTDRTVCRFIKYSLYASKIPASWELWKPLTEDNTGWWSRNLHLSSMMRDSRSLSDLGNRSEHDGRVRTNGHNFEEHSGPT